MLQFSPENNPSVFIVTMRLYKRQLFLYDEHFSRVCLKNWIPHLFQDKCKIWLVAFSPPEQPDNSISCGRSRRGEGGGGGGGEGGAEGGGGKGGSCDVIRDSFAHWLRPGGSPIILVIPLWSLHLLHERVLNDALLTPMQKLWQSTKASWRVQCYFLDMDEKTK